jgi:hypothetical protein
VLFGDKESISEVETSIKSFGIDELIEMLIRAKENGAKTVYFKYGSSYDS